MFVKTQDGNRIINLNSYSDIFYSSAYIEEIVNPLKDESEGIEHRETIKFIGTGESVVVASYKSNHFFEIVKGAFEQALDSEGNFFVMPEDLSNLLAESTLIKFLESKKRSELEEMLNSLLSKHFQAKELGN